jgi:thiamine-monophosphate kinase
MAPKANEGELVKQVERLIPSFEKGKLGLSGLRLGIGDDAAVLRVAGGVDWVVTTDAFMEGVHFLGGIHRADSVGYKALARATSDIAAMGATPRFFLLTLALPANRTGAWLTEFLRGIGRAAREFDLVLVGGDTTRTASVGISITVIGEIERGLAVKRAGATPGDAIYVSGRLGGAQLGLELVRRGLAGDRSLRRYLAPHLYPQIRLKLGHWLAQNQVASAMMDVSDGLSTDLPRLCEASGTGARLDASQIPCVEIPEAVARRLGKRTAGVRELATRRALEMALNGGDDYELLFTVPPAKEKKLRKAPEFSEMSRIGEIVRDRRILIAGPDGRPKELAARGWDPFRR